MMFDNNIDPKIALQQLKENWNYYLMLGIGLVAFGTLAIIFSLTSTLISVIYLGVSLIFLGFFEGAKAIRINKLSTFFLHLCLSILFIVGGALIIINPMGNALSLTFLLALFFIIAGILRVIFSFTQHIPHAGWLLFNGVITILLGALILYEWPYSGLWVIGTFVGIDMLFTGWTWIMLALQAKNLQK